MIQPTIGRRLWLKFSSRELGQNMGFNILNTEQACDAGVTYVWNDRMVNVLATDHYGGTKALTSVTLRQEGDPVPSVPFWLEWMPYQAAQAKKESAPIGSSKDELYSSIKIAMLDLSEIPEGSCDQVDRAFNRLYDAFWSEMPAPASAMPRRKTPEHHTEIIEGSANAT